MTEPEVFIAADSAFKKVLDQIKDDQWELAAPPGVSRKPANLRELINYHTYDEAWVPEVLAGKTAAEVGDKYDGDLIGADPKSAYAKYYEKAVAAVRAVTDLDKSVHLSYGDYPAREYLKHITSFRGFRAWEIARMIGVSDKLPNDLVEGMWELFKPEAEEWRKYGVFGPEVEVAPDADLQTKLLAMSGRKP